MIKIIFLALLLLFLVGCQDTPSESATDAGDKATSENERNKEHVTREETEQEPEEEEEEEEEEQVDDEEPSDEPKEDDETSEEEQTDITVTPENSVEFVKDHLQLGTGDTEFNYFYDGETDDGDYRVQVFRVVTPEEGDSHTSTHGWYLVDPDTGEVTDLFDQ